MTEEEILKRAFAMPLTNPAFPPGPYRFVNREYLIITYRTDPERLRAIVPEPLALDAPLVKYEFIRMPDSTGFGDYTESGQVIPVSLNGRRGSYTHCMFLDDESPIAGGRELWGFPKKLASPSLKIEKDTLVGTLDYGSVRVATGTMGYKHRTLDASQIKLAMREPNFWSRSFRTLMAPPASASSSNTGWRTSRYVAPGRGLARCSLTRTRWRLSPTCRCSRSSRPSTASPI